jgi:hypothetical protein
MNDMFGGLQPSNFRRTVHEAEFKLTLKKVAMAGGLTIILLVLMNTFPGLAVIAWPVGYLTYGATEAITNIATLAYLLFLSYFLLWIVFFRKIQAPRPTHLPCPHCNADVALISDWTCDKCQQAQGREKYLTERCTRCGKPLARYACEHCRQEFLL